MTRPPRPARRPARTRTARPARTRTARRPARTRTLAALALALAWLLVSPAAHAQQVTVSAEREIHAGLPFTLAVAAQGFDEDPAPEVAPFDIAGCTITFVGVSPSVSTSISIIGGRRTETRNVEFVYRYRVVPERPGTYRLPAITVTQGSKRAQSSPATFQAADIGTTRDMRVELELPDRVVTVGEPFDVTINWYLRKEVRDPHFTVPLFDEVLWVDVHQPQLNAMQRRNALAFPAGDRQIELPFVRDQVNVDGLEYTRFRFVASMTPIKAGTLELAPMHVVASLITGRGRDAFGFSTPRTQLFRAEDRARTLQVRALPARGRPASFASAVGTAFSIQVQASRTVVKLGEPVELQLLVRGDGRLEGLSLPRLDHDEGLPPALFSVSDTPPTGDIVDLGDGQGGSGGKAKRFRVIAQVKSPEVREIPPIAFSYYNPRTERYETVYSEPIALSVEGTAVVGAGEVVSALQTPPAADPLEPAAPSSTGAWTVGADLSLSSGAVTLARPWRVASVRPLLILLYALPLLLLGVRVWQVRTRARRDRSSETRKALRAAERALEDARSAPAREAGPRLLTALRALAACTDQGGLRGADVIARIETEAYSPHAATAPLDGAILDEARTLAQRLAAREPGAARSASTGLAVLLLPWLVAGMWGAPMAHAASDDERLQAARAAYQAALAETERDARAGAFARAERMFRALVDTWPDRPELLADWGNAALGAQDLGRATLAYRRALALDPDLARAERNLSWARSRAPGWLPVPRTQRAGDSLFFWHRALSVPARHVIGGAAFLVAVLLLLPWGRRQRALRRLAVIPILLWAAMIASVLLDERPVNHAVIITDSVPMLSADSLGAPAAITQPLPAGAEVSILETRGAWTRITLADGARGWVSSSAVERVLPPDR